MRLRSTMCCTSRSLNSATNCDFILSRSNRAKRRLRYCGWKPNCSAFLSLRDALRSRAKCSSRIFGPHWKSSPSYLIGASSPGQWHCNTHNLTNYVRLRRQIERTDRSRGDDVAAELEGIPGASGAGPADPRLAVFREFINSLGTDAEGESREG